MVDDEEQRSPPRDCGRELMSFSFALRTCTVPHANVTGFDSAFHCSCASEQSLDVRPDRLCCDSTGPEVRSCLQLHCHTSLTPLGYSEERTTSG